MKNIGIGFFVLVVGIVVGIFVGIFITKDKEVPIEKKIVDIIERPLEKYTFENLRKTQFPPNKITLGEVIDESETHISQMFYFNVISEKKTKKVSGLINIPKDEGVYPAIVMFRGFVPIEIYETGVGTKRGGQIFAENGFITLAPDFLGYGESDNPSEDVMEERFQTYITALSLFSSLESLNTELSASYSGITADTEKVGIWAHSNGGQIALSTLEITGRNYPTVLWAPVSKPFPYSILYYTDEFEDHGKKLRKVVANFEDIYDIEQYSPTNFYSWINAPMQIHQGVEDDAVPQKWSSQLVEDLKGLGRDVTYFAYPNADHNLMPDGWDKAIENSTIFYKEHFEE
ncbi:prolyl oligopeptidase family serine peptidase [Candidatus Roizmanbacteria bacterium]|nr:prolyl oligopeptidase family serine peptidase [Candidatus Roizmanbacteria bacterium]